MDQKGIAYKRNKARKAVKACDPLLGGDPSVQFTLPASIKIFGRSDHVLDKAEDYVVVINGVNRAAPDLSAQQVTDQVLFPIGYFPKGTTVQGFAGITLYIDAGLGRYVPIGG